MTRRQRKIQRLQKKFDRHWSQVEQILSMQRSIQDWSPSLEEALDFMRPTTIKLRAQIDALLSEEVEYLKSCSTQLPPQLGERILLLVLSTKEERINIPGDLEEEFKQIAAKHGARYAKLWYYKQVAASAWPMARKAVGWGLLASIGAWIRRFI